MKGTIKAYSDVVSAGVIEGLDGKTYSFSISDWYGRKLPENRERVIFEGHSRQAVRVKTEDGGQDAA